MGLVSLEEYELWLEHLVDDLNANGDTVPEYLCQVFRAREDARQALLELHERGSATQRLISRYLVARHAVPQHLYATARSIEQSRRQVVMSLEETYSSAFK